MPYPSWSIRVATPPTVEPLLLADAKAHCRVDTPFEDDDFTEWITTARLTIESQFSRALVTQTIELRLDDFPYSQDRIRLPRGMLQKVNSVTYYDTSGNPYTLTQGTDFFVDQYGYPYAQIVLPFGHVWPQVTLNTSAAIVINFTAGWVPYSSTVNVTGNAITWVSGSLFDPGILGQRVSINGVATAIAGYVSPTALIASSAPGNGNGVTFTGTPVPLKFLQAMKLLVGHWYQNRESVVVGRTSTIATEVPLGVQLLLADENLSRYSPFDA